LRHALALLALAACLDDKPTATGRPTVRATLNANVVGEAAVAGGTVQIRVGYRAGNQQFIALPSSPTEIAVAAGKTVVLPVTVDIGPCLSDQSRLGGGEPGCLLTIELTLSDATGNAIDRQTRDARNGPVTPGQAVDFGTVTIGLTVSAVTVAPASLGLSVPDESRLTATVRDASGAVTTVPQVSWTVGDASVAQLSATTGASITVRALKLGSTSVTATAGGKTSAAVPVNVVPPPPLVLRQRQGAGCVLVGQTINLDVDTPPGPVTWSSATTSVATINSTGLLTGIAAGQSVITATSGNRTGTLTVCVTGPLRVASTTITLTVGQTAQIGATGVTGGTLTYASNATSVATVDGSGVVRGVSPGNATVTATFTGPSGSQSISVRVTVNPIVIGIAPTTASAALTRTATFTVSAKDATGATVPVSATWTIDDPSVGALLATTGGAVDVRALKIGTTTVRASAGGATASATFAATQQLPAARLEKVSGDGAVCPTRSTSCTFVVRAVDVNGAAVPNASVSWSSATSCGSAKLVATDANGLASSTNICSAAPAGTYTQLATLASNGQQVSFSYSLRGLVLTLLTAFQYSVTSPSGPATGLAASVQYRVGGTGYVTKLDLSGTSTPATVSVGWNESALPAGNYVFDLMVATTTTGIGPAVETISFTVDSSSFGRQPPNDSAGRTASRVRRPARLP
jgi:uncharacterized protein YjdB